MGKHGLKILGLLSVALLAALFAPQRVLADDDDPPGRVARLSYTHGAVSFQPAGTDDWVAAVVNRPITTGDKLWADNDSRAELHIGSASLRMAGNTGFSFLNLTDNVTQIQLTAGTLRVRVKRLDENETFEVDTPNLAFSVLRPGTYRINVNESGDATVIKVRGGEGEITGGGSAFALRPREVGVFNGTDQLTADIESYGNDDDDFDDWCADRDRHEDLSVSARYVSPDVIGYQDLDEYGGWRPVPEYGMVWFPRTTVVDWAPYRYGHWAYVSPWGYTWIDDAPWGFAPFHYGRWINYGGVWGWVPCPPPAAGVVYVRPVYAPALVAWVGGPHFGVGIAVGGGMAAGVHVGWFPLGPREVYVPSYPVSRTYVTNVNVSNTTVNTTVINNYYNTTIVNRNTTVVNNNVTVIQQTYVNQRVAGAVTATTSQAFVSAQPISRNVVRIDTREVARASVSTFTPPVAPAKQAVLGTGRVNVARPPAVIETRAVVARTAPPPPPVSFARQQQAIQANGGRPLAVSQVRQIQPQGPQTVHPQVRILAPAQPVVPQGVQGRGVGQPPNVGSSAAGKNGGPGSAPGVVGRPYANTNSAGTPNNSIPPTMGNKPGNAPADAGNANYNRRTFEDRPPSATSNPSTPNSTGQPPTGNKPGSTLTYGNNANGNRKTYEDRPPSATSNPSTPNSTGQPPTGNKPGSTLTYGNDANGNRRTFDDRPASATNSPSAPNTTGQPPTGNRPGSTLTYGSNGNDNRRTFDDHPVSAHPSGGNTSPGGSSSNTAGGNAIAGGGSSHPGGSSNAGNGGVSGMNRPQQLNQTHQQQTVTQEQRHDSQPQKPQGKQQDEHKNTSSKSDKDDHKQ